MEKKSGKYTDFPNVEAQRNFLTAEEFPEGAYGIASDDSRHEPVQNKNTPWHKGQRYYSAFNYLYGTRNRHENYDRNYSKYDPMHDNPARDSHTPNDEK